MLLNLAIIYFGFNLESFIFMMGSVPHKEEFENVAEMIVVYSIMFFVSPIIFILVHARPEIIKEEV